MIKWERKVRSVPPCFLHGSDSLHPPTFAAILSAGEAFSLSLDLSLSHSVFFMIDNTDWGVCCWKWELTDTIIPGALLFSLFPASYSRKEWPY